MTLSKHNPATGVYYEQGKLEEAVATYKQALAMEPVFPEAYNNLGNTLREAGRPDEAVGCYTMCIRQQLQQQTALPPGQSLPAQQAQRLSVAYNNLGGILKMQGRVVEAITCYEHVALLQPELPEAHANLASAYKDAARHDAAITSYTQALRLKNDFPEAFANLVHSLQVRALFCGIPVEYTCAYTLSVNTQCVCDWRDRERLFLRLEVDVRRDLAAGRLPPVQPFHAMAYPFSADLALAISKQYAAYCALTATRISVPPLAHPPRVPLQPGV